MNPGFQRFSVNRELMQRIAHVAQWKLPENIFRCDTHDASAHIIRIASHRNISKRITHIETDMYAYTPCMAKIQKRKEPNFSLSYFAQDTKKPGDCPPAYVHVYAMLRC